MAVRNKFGGNIPIGVVRNGAIYASPAFMIWLDEQLELAGGVDQSSVVIEAAALTPAAFLTAPETRDLGPVLNVTTESDFAPVDAPSGGMEAFDPV